MQVEQDEREIAIAKQEVDGLNGLRDFAATDPKEALAFEIAVRGGIEGIASVDQGEGELAFFVEEFGNEQSHALAGMRGDDFVERAALEG